MSETWKSVVGFEGLYEVSDLGNIKSVRTGKAMRPHALPERYPHVTLSRSGLEVSAYVHDLVTEAFIGPKPEGYEVNHINLNKRDNRLENLEYCTCQENIKHAIEHGAINRRGEAHHGAKLTEAIVASIRSRLASGEKAKVLSEEYGVGVVQIRRIESGQRWHHSFQEK
jgi:hypothetical protein